MIHGSRLHGSYIYQLSQRLPIWAVYHDDMWFGTERNLWAQCVVFSLGMSGFAMGSRVYVGRLSYRAHERDIERFFRGYGRITEILLKNGYAFVEFSDRRDAEDAVHDLNGRSLLGDRFFF
ncbi:unnamed protein product, partial [Onchocerca flexuosa]|uniref:RRM domain-containing protein n=1 Tax=Onchocerca flexuosa TaxID=387005 RepID=A0A183HD47_9BILA